MSTIKAAPDRETLSSETDVVTPQGEKAEQSPGFIDKIAGMVSNIAGELSGHIRKHKNNIRSIVTENGLNFYTFDPETKKLIPIDGLQGVTHQISKRIDVDRIFTDHPFVIEYADTRKGRWISVFDMTNKKVIPLIQMEVSGQIKFEGDMIRIQRNGQEDMYFFYKDGSFYTFDTKAYYGYGALLSGLMRKVTKGSTKKKPIPHDFEDAKKYLILTTTPLVVR